MNSFSFASPCIKMKKISSIYLIQMRGFSTYMRGFINSSLTASAKLKALTPLFLKTSLAQFSHKPPHRWAQGSKRASLTMAIGDIVLREIIADAFCIFHTLSISSFLHLAGFPKTKLARSTFPRSFCSFARAKSATSSLMFSLTTSSAT